MQLYAMILQTCTARKILWIENGIFDSLGHKGLYHGRCQLSSGGIKKFFPLVTRASRQSERAKSRAGGQTKKADGSGKKAAAKAAPGILKNATQENCTKRLIL